MARSIVVREFGGPEVLVAEDVDIGHLAADEILLRQTAAGVNFHDIYVRSGLYDTLDLPGTPGCEAVGTVLRVGSDVDHISVGDRVGYVTPRYGGYAEERRLPAALAIPIPDEIDDDAAAANLLRAMTVEMLTRRVVKVTAGMTVLVHAAAGGVGRLLCSVAAAAGARVIGTVGSTEKAAIAAAHGCHDTILYREVDFVEAVHDLVGPTAVHTVFDSVGADTFDGSLEVLAYAGHLVNFGQSSGPVEPVAMSTLATKSLTVSRPIIFHYLNDPAMYQQMAAVALDWFVTGQLHATEVTRVPLEEAPRAHELLASRDWRGGSIVLHSDRC